MTAQADIGLNHRELGQFYKTYFEYYSTLGPENQDLFRKRCIRFIKEKEIIGAEGFEPENRVKAMVAASAVQLTLGLETWELSYFDTIIIHPSDFENKPSGLKFRGETNLKGYLRLSWLSFIHGYKNNSDNINLGIHEFSHALRFNGIRGEEQDYFVQYYFDSWLAAAYGAFYDIKDRKETIFRKYGGSNINEFISVCIEHYFESPLEIKDSYPELYYSTGILLNQANINGKTQLDIRINFLKEKNNCLPGIKDRGFVTPVLDDPKFVSLIVILFPLVFTGFSVGFLSGASLILIVIFVMVFLRFDFHSSRVFFTDKYFSVEKGFLVFKRQMNRIPLSHLVSVKISRTEKGSDEWSFIYFNVDDKHFHEETSSPPYFESKLFVKEIFKNKIAYLMQ